MQYVLAFGFWQPRWGTRWRGHSAIWPRLCAAELPAQAKGHLLGGDVEGNTGDTTIRIDHALQLRFAEANAICFEVWAWQPRWGTRWRGHSAIWPRLCAAELSALAAASQQLHEALAVSHTNACICWVERGGGPRARSWWLLAAPGRSVWLIVALGGSW